MLASALTVLGPAAETVRGLLPTDELLLDRCNLVTRRGNPLSCQHVRARDRSSPTLVLAQILSGLVCVGGTLFGTDLPRVTGLVQIRPWVDLVIRGWLWPSKLLRL
jgi:hypothetical protein